MDTLEGLVAFYALAFGWVAFAAILFRMLVLLVTGGEEPQPERWEDCITYHTSRSLDR